MTYQTQEKPLHSELDKKRWLVRYMLIAAVAMVLAFKVYLLLYVIDFTLGAQFLFKLYLTERSYLHKYTKLLRVFGLI